MATSLELAITAIRSGRKEEGRQLLNLLIQQNPNNEMAWLWMSSVVNTDEQRARCLYHVLAINPDNELARRGLQILGIVVSDSRPVKVPRDSQPIPVQRPQPEAVTPWPVPPTAPAATNPVDTQPLAQTPAKIEPVPATSPAATPPDERRPFRLDPKAITQELPFVPLREPFGEPGRRSPSAFAQRGADGSGSTETAPGGLNSPPAPIEASDASKQSEVSLPDFPAALAPDAGANSFSTPPQPSQTPPPIPQQQAFVPDMPVNETRPSQPVWVTHSNATMGMPTPQNPSAYPAPGFNSNVTMGMPSPYLPPQNPIQGVPAIHSNTTMGLPMPVNGQLPHAPGMMPPVQPNHLMSYQPAMFSPAYPQNQVFHASSTMAMPTMTEAEARAHLYNGQPLPVPADPYAALRAAAAPHPSPQVPKKNNKKGAKDDEEEDEVNLLAVIVFGSLSVTALGGMGMLILLWFTSV